MRRPRGLLLPAVLGAIVLFSILYFAVSRNLSQAHHRLSVSKHQEAARWLAESGLEVGQARVHSGRLRSGETLRGSFAQGSFEVQLVGNELLSTGIAGQQRHQERKTVVR